MKQLIIFLLIVSPVFTYGQFVTQGVATQNTGYGNYSFTINGISQSPYAGRVFNTSPVNLNNDFDLKLNIYLGNNFNNGMAFIFMPGAVPTATYPPTVINTDNIHNFGTGSIATDFIIEFDIRGSFCTAGQNTSYEPTTDINHISYWKNNSACNFGNYFSPYSALGTVNYYAYEPYEIKWTKSSNTLQTYYNNVLIKSNIIDLVALLGTSVYWGFSSGCYCVTGGPAVQDMILNGTTLATKLAGFKAIPGDHSVKLNWNTAAEQQSSHFILERSIDGNNFIPFTRVEAMGNSNTPHNYSFDDTKPFLGMNYYRLKMVDLDGQFTYSEIERVQFNRKTGISLYPNPVQNELQVKIASDKKETAVIEIKDMTGKTLRSKTVQLDGSLYTSYIDVNDLDKGIYLLLVNFADRKETGKFIKN